VLVEGDAADGGQLAGEPGAFQTVGQEPNPFHHLTLAVVPVLPRSTANATSRCRKVDLEGHAVE